MPRSPDGETRAAGLRGGGQIWSQGRVDTGTQGCWLSPRDGAGACVAQSPRCPSLGLKVPPSFTGRPPRRGGTAHVPSPAQSRGSLHPDTRGPRQPPRGTKEDSPPWAGALVGLWRPWQLRKAGIARGNSTPSATAPASGTGPAGQPGFFGVGLKNKQRAAGEPGIKLTAPPQGRGADTGCEGRYGHEGSGLAAPSEAKAS